MGKYTSENLIVFTILMVCTLGMYGLIWLGRTSASFSDDPTTNVVMAVVTCGMWNLVLNLRYFARSEELNGRQVQWYNAIIVIMGGPLIGPLMIQQNINEYNTRSAA
jgi:hypothetical protein